MNISCGGRVFRDNGCLRRHFNDSFGKGNDVTVNDNAVCRIGNYQLRPPGFSAYGLGNTIVLILGNYEGSSLR